MYCRNISIGFYLFVISFIHCIVCFSIFSSNNFITSSMLSRMSFKHWTKGKHLIGYTSDIEGNFRYWQKYIQQSQVLYRKPETGKLTLRDDAIFVYGGDVCDRGSGDIRLLQDLIELKETYTDRVHFILGNRDVNKFRLPFTLHQRYLAYNPGSYWTPTTPLDSDYELNDRVSKMKWTLKGTMGSPFAFEARREELNDLNLPSTDEDVVQSYLDLILPGGLLFKYLKYAKISVIIEDIIFVHGALSDYYLGWVPPHVADISSGSTSFTEPSEVLCTPLEWTQKINEFAFNEVVSYENSCQQYLTTLSNLPADISQQELEKYSWDYMGGYDHPQPGSRLVQFGMGSLPDKSRNPTVIYTSYLEGGKPVLLTTKVAQWLQRDGISRIIVGHQPNGDAPLITYTDNVYCISADTCYSKFVLWPKPILAQSPIVKELERQYPLLTPTIEEDKQASMDTFLSSDRYVDSLKSKVPNLPNEKKNLPSVASDTRNEHSFTEVVFTFDAVPQVNHDEKSPRLDIPQASNIVTHGVLSQGSLFEGVILANEPLETQMIARPTVDNWYIKGNNVIDPTEEQPSTKQYVLSYSEFFDFKAQIVNETTLKSKLP